MWREKRISMSDPGAAVDSRTAKSSAGTGSQWNFAAAMVVAREHISQTRLTRPSRAKSDHEFVFVIGADPGGRECIPPKICKAGLPGATKNRGETTE
jgi:hypothetical protein